jgi:hypothetical protein
MTAYCWCLKIRDITGFLVDCYYNKTERKCFDINAMYSSLVWTSRGQHDTVVFLITDLFFLYIKCMQMKSWNLKKTPLNIICLIPLRINPCIIVRYFYSSTRQLKSFYIFWQRGSAKIEPFTWQLSHFAIN